MGYSKLLSEILKQTWAIKAEFAEAYKPNIINLLNGRPFIEGAVEKGPLMYKLHSAGSYIEIPFNDEKEKPETPEDSVAIIDIRGALTPYGNICQYGTEDYSAMIAAYEADPNIIGSILTYDTPGGSTSAVFCMENQLRKCKKPIVAMVKGDMHSAGMYLGSFANKIVAQHRMTEVGSIGVMCTLVDTRGMDKEQGIKITYLYPPESKWKNKAESDALDGKPEQLIKEQLTPWAQHFQNTIKTNRPKLDTTIEGILEGKTFYAYDAKAYGLIDDIMNMDEAVALVRQLADRNKKAIQIINN